jgi:hypothetical protein
VPAGSTAPKSNVAGAVALRENCMMTPLRTPIASILDSADRFTVASACRQCSNQARVFGPGAERAGRASSSHGWAR